MWYANFNQAKGQSVFTSVCLCVWQCVGVCEHLYVCVYVCTAGSAGTQRPLGCEIESACVLSIVHLLLDT